MPNGRLRIELTLPGIFLDTRSRTNSSIDRDASAGPDAAAPGAGWAAAGAGWDAAASSPARTAQADNSSGVSAAITMAFIFGSTWPRAPRRHASLTGSGDPGVGTIDRPARNQPIARRTSRFFRGGAA